MNTQLFTLALIEIIISIIATVLIIYVSHKILQKLFFKQQKLQGNNLAFTIFTSGIILSIGIILSEIFPFITNVIRLAATSEVSTNSTTTIISYSALYLFIGFIAAVLINVTVFLLFSILTKGVDEFNEIKNNNISVAILVVAILISITLIAKESIALIISSIIPYPEVSNFL